MARSQNPGAGKAAGSMWANIIHDLLRTEQHESPVEDQRMLGQECNKWVTTGSRGTTQGGRDQRDTDSGATKSLDGQLTPVGRIHQNYAQ